MASPSPPPQAQPTQDEAAIQTPVPSTSGVQIDNIPAAALEAGDDASTDDGYESAGGGSSTTSISSSIKAHVWENGRRYNKFREGQYALPNDEGEQNREDMKHAMTLMLCNGLLHFAPIGDNPQNIIDLGTGTGIWALDMADKYPSALVEGIDLSPIQPLWVAPNSKFIVDDVEDSWTYPLDHFDLVHLRVLVAHMRDIPKLFEQSYKHIKPGGWIEIQDHENIPYCDDGSMPENYAPKEMLLMTKEALAVFGKDTTAILSADEKLAVAGFTNITHRVFKLPVGPWPKGKEQKLLGLFWRTAILDGLQGIAMGTFGRGKKWSPEDIEVYLVGVRKALMDNSIHTYWPYHIITAQKPLTYEVGKQGEVSRYESRHRT